MLDRNHNGSYSFKNVKDLSTRVKERTGYHLTDEAAFRNQACPGTGTVFAVTRNTVMTAGHCSKVVFQDKLKVVFNFRLGKESFAANEVYDVKGAIQGYTKDDLEKPDWGWMELDRDIEGRNPLDVEMAPIESKAAISMLGHPSGILMKYCEGNVEGVEHPNYFTAKIDAFGGNSGSPVFNERGNVIGILYSGYGDHDPVENYKGTGERRTQWLRIHGKLYGQCHRIAKTMFAVARKINEVGLYTIHEKRDRSNWQSNIFFQNRQWLEDFHKKHKFLGFLFHVARHEFEERKQKEHDLAKAICFFENDINYIEADFFIRKIEPINILKKLPEIGREEMIKCLRNMVIYQVSEEEALKIGRFEEIFQKCFKVPYSRESVQALLRG